MKIGENILFWTGMYAGSGLVFGKRGIVIVDTQMRGDQAGLIIELMRLYGLDPKSVRYIVNTHGDLDHIGGNAELIRATGASLVAHAEEVGRIENPPEVWPGLSRFVMARYGPLRGRRVKVMIREDTVLEAGDVGVRVVCTPGHTPGSVCVYHEDSKALFSGDVVLGRGAPYKVPLVRMDVETYIHSLEKLDKLQVEWLLPGHGDVVHDGNKKIRQHVRELRRLPRRVLGMIEGGVTTPSEVSERLLVWPQTINTVFSMLEREGKIWRVEREIPSKSVGWVPA
ncbi:MAG: MBL fold metallo-hydrolase [Candidatus Bathyarchaeia archaeon]